MYVCVYVTCRHTQWQRLREFQNSFMNVKRALSKQTTETVTLTHPRRMCRPAVDMHTHTHTLKLVEICCVSNTLSKCKVRLHRILTIRRLNASQSVQQLFSVSGVCVQQTKEFVTFLWLMCMQGVCVYCVCLSALQLVIYLLPTYGKCQCQDEQWTLDMVLLGLML